MKKFVLIILCVCFCFLAVGCEGETKVRTAHIANITAAMSSDYAIKVTIDDDDRVRDKFVDLQIKSSKEEQLLTFGQELKDSFTICLPKSDFWYNLTYLISQTNGTGEEAGYIKHEDFGSRVFLFSSKNDVDLIFRVVAGQTKQNEDTEEEILVLSEDISGEVVVRMKKHKG